MALFRLRGWANGTVRALEMRNQSFEMTAALIGPPSMDAIGIRRHGNVDSDVATAVFRRAQQPPAIDGSSRGWEASDSNVSLWADGSHHVSAQLLHDDTTIYIRATIRLGAALQPVKLYPDFQRLFVHGTGATTLSFYLQVQEAPSTNASTLFRPLDSLAVIIVDGILAPARKMGKGAHGRGWG